MNHFFSKYEEISYSKLKPICEENGAHVFPKVRLIDAIPDIRKSDTWVSFALKSHLDFFITDIDYHPLFAVEFDGSYHNSELQKSRDNIKNDLCDRFKLPLLRINGGFLNRNYRDMDLLTYFIEVWFLNSAFNEAQENGDIPLDEIFDEAFIYSDPKHPNKKWPYWLSIDIQNEIRNLHQQGLVFDANISHWIGIDNTGVYNCISWFRITKDHFVYTRKNMRSQKFPIIESDLLRSIAVFEVYGKIQDVLSGKIFARTESSFMQLMYFYENTYQLHGFSI